MSCPSNRLRPTRRFPILGVFGILLLTAGVVAIATNAFACPNCNCYYSRDCASGQTCSYTSGCRDWYTGGGTSGKHIDGTCTGTATATPVDPLNAVTAAQALDFWMQAYEHGGRLGGEPDETMIARALSLPLSPEQHQAIRLAAINTQVILFGLTSDPDDEAGLFTLPATAIEICQVDGTPNQTSTTAERTANGALKKFDENDARVAAIVRQAMVEELRNPYSGNFGRIIARIGKEIPKFEASGICRNDGGHFPFASSLECLRQETLGTVRALLDPADFGQSSHRPRQD